jgi:hypothetical protein
MRTTLTIHDDLAAILERERKIKGMTFKEVVNAALRRGLAEEAVMPKKRRVVTRPLALGIRAGIDPDKLNQLADELEAEEFAAKILK